MTSQFARQLKQDKDLLQATARSEEREGFDNELFFEQQNESGQPDELVDTVNALYLAQMQEAIQTKSQKMGPKGLPSSKMVRTKAFQIDSKDKSLDQMSSHDFDSEKVQPPKQVRRQVSKTMTMMEYNAEDVKSNNSFTKARSEQIFATIQQSNSMQQTPRDGQLTRRALLATEENQDAQSAQIVSEAAPSRIQMAPKLVPGPDECCYGACIIAQNVALDKIISLKRRTNRLQDRALNELDKRLKASYGETKEKVVDQQSGLNQQLSQQQNRRRRPIQQISRDQTFSQELIEPCDCRAKYHRICIRDKIVTGLLKECPICQASYSVGFSDCYALLNKHRPNYLAYMLVQEILFFLSIIVFSEVVRWTSIYCWNNDNPAMLLQWFIILMTLTTAVTGLALVTFFIRLRGLYLHREIDDVIIFDKSQRQELDFDSPAILSVFFQDIQHYEAQQKYYKKSIADRYLDKTSGLLGTPFQRVRSLITDINIKND